MVLPAQQSKHHAIQQGGAHRGLKVLCALCAVDALRGEVRGQLFVERLPRRAVRVLELCAYELSLSHHHAA
jgi:hypothetical protein